MRSRVAVIALVLVCGGLLFSYLFRSGQRDADASSVVSTRSEADAQAESLSATNAANVRVEDDPQDIGPVTPPHAGCSLSIVCHNESGARVEGVQYWVHADGKAVRAHSQVDPAADSVWLDGAHSTGTLAIRARGYADLLLALPVCPSPVLTLRLTAECSLAGVVTQPSGDRVAGLTLVALPMPTQLTPKLVNLQSPAATCAGILVCTSDAQGRFAFQGAQAQRPYAIYGGGAGLMLAKGYTQVKAPRDDLNLVVVPVYAALVTVSDASGVPVSIRSDSGVTLEFYIEDRRFSPMAARSFEAVLAGLPPEFLEPAPNEFLALVTGDANDASAGPCQLAIVAPGYSPQQLSFRAPRLNAELARIPFVLPATTAAFGAVQVRFVRERLGGTPQPSEVTAWPSGRVRLESTQGDVLKYRHTGVTNSLRIERVPTGTYSLRFEADVGGFRYPAVNEPGLRVEVTSQPALVDIPLTDTGVIELKVVDGRSGEDYTGPLSLMVSQAENATDSPDSGTVLGLFPASFEYPPYQVPVAGPGTYKLVIGFPQRDPKLHPHATDLVNVEAGSTTRHLITVLP